MIFLFSRFNQIFITQAPTAVTNEKAAEEVIAIVYRGSSDDGHKYCPVLEIVLIELRNGRNLPESK